MSTINCSVATIIETLRTEVQGILQIVIFDIASGNTIAVGDWQAGSDATRISACSAMMLSETTRLLKSTKLTSDTVEEIVSKIDQHLHILRPIQGGRLCISVLADATVSNLSWTRQALAKYT